MKNFKILHKDGKARVGKLTTPHGAIDTPNFIPVGTLGAVKALGPRELKEIGAEIILANTYHLMLRPGADLIEKFGGLHKFMDWNKPLMTDSGGFQVFSLGADLIVAFDDHESSKHTKKEMVKSLELTESWGLRSLEVHTRKGVKLIHPEGGNVSTPILYGVVHGGTHKDLRVRSARFTDEHFDAIAIGGIYGDKQKLCQILNWVVPEVTENKPRHLLGIGEVEDLFNGVESGMDFFDCVPPACYTP